MSTKKNRIEENIDGIDLKSELKEVATLLKNSSAEDIKKIKNYIGIFDR
ncbi:MAG: hypothetical protein AB1391_02280 [Candidatus Micrarchaeota archaeon]